MRGSLAAHYGAHCGANCGAHYGAHRETNHGKHREARHGYPPLIGIFISIVLLCYALAANAAQAQRLPDFLKTVAIAEIFPGADRLGPPKASR